MRASPRIRFRRLKVTRGWPVSADDIHDPLRHHNYLLDRPTGQGSHYRLQPERRRLDLILASGAGHRQFIPPLAVYLYGNGNHIVNEQRCVCVRPGLIGEQGVVSEPLPTVFRQMRQYWADHLNEELGGFADGPVEAVARSLERRRERVGELVNLRDRHVVAQALKVLANIVQRLVGRTAQEGGLGSEERRWIRLGVSALDDLVDEPRNALDLAASARNTGLGPDDVAVGRAVRHNKEARRIGPVVGDDVIGIDHVLARLRHFLDRADLNGAARGNGKSFAGSTLTLDANLCGRQPVAIFAAIGLVDHDTLCEHGGERLVDRNVPSRLHAAREEAGVEEVQYRMLLATDVLVNRSPVLEGFLVGRGFGVGRAIAELVPGAVDE